MSASFSSFDGARIAYSESGSGPTVVLIHGYSASAEVNWVQPGIFGALVAGGRRVIALDLRGHGESDKPQELRAYEDRALARDVVALADHLELEGYDVVGYSLGSIVALSVVLLDPRARSLVIGGLGDLVMDPEWERPKRLVAGLLGDEEARAAEPMVRLMLWLVEHAGADRMALAGVQHGHVAVTAPELSKIAIPTLVVVGLDDDVNGDPRVLADAIQGASLVRVPGDHTAAVTEPELLHCIESFLEGVSPATSRQGM